MTLPLPSEFEDVIISEDDSVCDGFVKLIKFSILLWRFMVWMYASESSTSEFSNAFKAMICNVVCADAATTEANEV